MENLVREYFKTHNPRLIVVVGGVGKTITQYSIATVLSQRFRLRMAKGNYNTDMSVPPSILGVDYPEDSKSITQWMAVLRQMKKKVNAPLDVDVIIQELGTDHPGEILHFGTYLKPDIAVVTSIVPEHMENFSGMDDVAREELSVSKYSNILFINRDDMDGRYAPLVETKRIDTYGLDEPAEYHFKFRSDDSLKGYEGDFISPELSEVPVKVKLVGQHNLRAAICAGALAVKFGMTPDEITKGIELLRPLPGRMNIFEGRGGTTIIDDTYNSSPVAAMAALDTLYEVDSPQRIAILGSMNEMGLASQEVHEQVGNYCDPVALEYVVTIGKQAAEYLAPVAEAKHCRVKSFLNPMQAGLFVNKIMQEGAVILVKGSQNGVFAEEATKVLLANTNDYEKLVRQTPTWMAAKKDLLELDK